MKPYEGKKVSDTPEAMRCGHASCKCVLSADRPHGNYCSEHCREAADLTELRCGCEHAECR